MGTFSLLILLASLICFVIGLINPKSFKRWFGETINRKRIALIFGGLAIASFIMFGMFSNPSASQAENGAASNKTLDALATKKEPVVEIKEVTNNEEVIFETKTQDDLTLAKGETKVKQEGVNGIKEIKYKVTYTDGVETSRLKTTETVTTQPTDKIVLNGTKTAQKAISSSPSSTTTTQSESSCDPNYSGACVPIASDVDCAGGSGNGPAYVKGPVNVIGKDIYDLDRDGNGVGCES